jgi:GntR family transcriptional regulator
MPSSPNQNGKVVQLDQKLDPSLPIPLYHQAYEVMRNWIAAGTFSGGDNFPTESALCGILGVSRITIKRALSEMADEGLISRHRGRGTVVEAARSRGIMRADFGEMMKNLLDVVETTEVELMREGQAIAPPDVADDLKLLAGTPTFQMLRRRLVEGKPYVYSDSYIPTDVAAKFPEHSTKETSLLRLLNSAGFPPLEACQRMTAASADDFIAAALDLEVGDPVLKVVRVFRTADLRPVQHTTMFFRPDRYEYTLILPAADAIY